jgi:hypothetical protein
MAIRPGSDGEFEDGAATGRVRRIGATAVSSAIEH